MTSAHSRGANYSSISVPQQLRSLPDVSRRLTLPARRRGTIIINMRLPKLLTLSLRSANSILSTSTTLSTSTPPLRSHSQILRISRSPRCIRHRSCNYLQRNMFRRPSGPYLRYRGWAMEIRLVQAIPLTQNFVGRNPISFLPHLHLHYRHPLPRPHRYPAQLCHPHPLLHLQPTPSHRRHRPPAIGTGTSFPSSHTSKTYRSSPIHGCPNTKDCSLKSWPGGRS